MKMPKKFEISRMFVIFFILGVAFSAFLGILAGNYVSSRKLKKETSNTASQIAFKTGDTFPNVMLKSLAEEEISLHDLMNGKKAFLLILATGNPNCEEEVSKWQKTVNFMPENYILIGISPEPIADLKNYQTQKGLRFTLLNDPQAAFVSKYQINYYPTLIGVDQNKKIIFIQSEYFTGTTPQDFLKKL